MKLTPFDALMERIAPHRAAGEKLAQKFGAACYWVAQSGKPKDEKERHERHDIGVAGLFGLLQSWFDKHRELDPFDARDAFGKDTPLREFHRLTQQAMGRVHGSSAFAYANSMMGEQWSNICHSRAGERVYEVSPGLASLLARTELRGIHGLDMRLPYRNIYIGLPLSAGVKDFEGDRVVGFFVTESPATADPRPGKEEDPEANKGKSWWIMAVSEEVKPKTPDRGYTCFFFNVDLFDDDPVEAALERKEKALAGYPKSIRNAYTEGLGPNWRDHFRWVMNVVLYATHHPEAEIEEVITNPIYIKAKAKAEKAPKGSGKRERLHAELKNLRPMKRIVLGKSVPPPVESEEREPRELRVRTLVAGHWRNQVHGEGRALRKLIWIRPFWRGPEEAPELNPRRLLSVPVSDVR